MSCTGSRFDIWKRMDLVIEVSSGVWQFRIDASIMAFLKHLHDCPRLEARIFSHDYRRVAGQCSGIFREVSKTESRKHDKEQNGKHQYTADGCSSFQQGAPVPEYCTDDSKRLAHQAVFGMLHAPFAVGLAAVSDNGFMQATLPLPEVYGVFDRIPFATACTQVEPSSTDLYKWEYFRSPSRSCILNGRHRHRANPGFQSFRFRYNAGSFRHRFLQATNRKNRRGLMPI